MSSYFDDEKNAREYITMAADYQPGELIETFRRHVPVGSEVLEIGIGPGTDLDVLRKLYRAVGTDAAQPFLDIYLADHPEAEVFLLDAVKMETNRSFDGIYSNKVLVHLTRPELVESLTAQVRVLRPGGVALHSFWYGENEEDFSGLHFTYHTEQTIKAAVAGTELTVLEMERYTEMEERDSLWVVLSRDR